MSQRGVNIVFAGKSMCPRWGREADALWALAMDEDRGDRTAHRFRSGGKSRKASVREAGNTQRKVPIVSRKTNKKAKIDKHIRTCSLEKGNKVGLRMVKQLWEKPPRGRPCDCGEPGGVAVAESETVSGLLPRLQRGRAEVGVPQEGAPSHRRPTQTPCGETG